MQRKYKYTIYDVQNIHQFNAEQKSDKKCQILQQKKEMDIYMFYIYLLYVF